ncbi:MAG TPA: M42 family metallopeptidase [Bacillota bacterium]|nr:M42 family metallopeptidase [Bacillota bacterium]
MTVKEFLTTLSLAPGVSGFEDPVAAIVERAWSDLGCEVRRDNLGNVIALRRGTRPTGTRRLKVMLAAHLDEVGLIVTRIDRDGFLRFAGVQRPDFRQLLGKEVTVHGRRELPGVIGHPPPHLLSAEDSRKLPEPEDLFIDAGLTVAEAAELVAVGDPVTFRSGVWELKNGLLAGKALDDRSGVAALHQCLQELERSHPAADVYAVATVQEEVGLRGAVAGTYGVDPDLAIAVDVGYGDTPGVPEHLTWPPGKGPVIAVGGNVHPILHRDLIALARELDIPYQVEAIPGPTGTDAWAMQVARTGVPTALLSIPCRYMHSAVETIALADVTRSGRLLARFVCDRDLSYLEELAWK